MFTTGRTLRAFFSGACVSMLLASIVSAQDKPSSERGSVGPAALPILNLNPLARPAPEKTSVAQDSLFDFTLPRMMKPVGLTTPSDRGESSLSQAGAGPAQGPLRLTLDEALARAVATNALVAASAGVSAAHFHHKAMQSDYFPKVGAYLVNLHYNKFMGDDASRSAPDPVPSGPRRRVEVRRRFDEGVLAREFRAGNDRCRTSCEPHCALWGISDHVQAHCHRSGGFRPYPVRGAADSVHR